MKTRVGAILSMRHTSVFTVAVVLALGCRDETDRVIDSADSRSAGVPSDSVLTVNVSAGRLAASKVVAAGWRSFQLSRTDSAGHIVVAFQVDPNLTTERFVALLDSNPGTPAGAIALGGPEGLTSEVLVRLPAGRVIVACLSRGDDKHRHATQGEVAEVEVRSVLVAATADSPTVDALPPDSNVVTIPMSDFAFTGADQIPAATRFLKLRNRGLQDHQLRIARLNPGKTISDWLKDQDAASTVDGDFGMARLGTLNDAFLPVSFTPGHYVFYCLITDPKSGMQHVELGMMRQIIVIP